MQNQERMKNPLESKMKRFLNLYWLRPENGLLTTFKSKPFIYIKPSYTVENSLYLAFLLEKQG